MTADAAIEDKLEQAVADLHRPGGPAILHEAIRYSVFPGGARVRPQLCLAVEQACENAQSVCASGAAAALELLHCASLVHDDLPCFDDASLRRGKPSVHCVFGEPIAVLAGDAMIIAAFKVLANVYAFERGDAVLFARLHDILTDAIGAPDGIIAGQAWESEKFVDLRAYHRSKTGAMFVAAAKAGAVCAGDDPASWSALGERLGEAYQIADDLRDYLLDAAALGKPAGQDARCSRPNAVETLGEEGARDQLQELIRDAEDAVPDCAGAEALRTLVRSQARRLMSACATKRVA
ncbi:MAG: polyprenyl synthetase family protein [Pseudomonadota bacterium]